MRPFLFILFAMAISLVPVEVLADPIHFNVTATVTADNHYILFEGNSNGLGITEVGRNEIIREGKPGVYNWSIPEQFKFRLPYGHTVYVAAWSDDSVAQGLIGQFDMFDPRSDSVIRYVTDTVKWSWVGTGHDYDTGMVGPSKRDVEDHTKKAEWLPVVNSVNNGAGPWGRIGYIDSSAKWIWGDVLLGNALTNTEYHIYRLDMYSSGHVAVPEPATCLLFVVGLAGLIYRRRRGQTVNIDTDFSSRSF